MRLSGRAAACHPEHTKWSKVKTTQLLISEDSQPVSTRWGCWVCIFPGVHEPSININKHGINQLDLWSSQAELPPGVSFNQGCFKGLGWKGGIFFVLQIKRLPLMPLTHWKCLWFVIYSARLKLSMLMLHENSHHSPPACDLLAHDLQIPSVADHCHERSENLKAVKDVKVSQVSQDCYTECMRDHWFWGLKNWIVWTRRVATRGAHIWDMASNNVLGWLHRRCSAYRASCNQYMQVLQMRIWQSFHVISLSRITKNSANPCKSQVPDSHPRF